MGAAIVNFPKSSAIEVPAASLHPAALLPTPPYCLISHSPPLIALNAIPHRACHLGVSCCTNKESQHREYQEGSGSYLGTCHLRLNHNTMST